MVSLPSAVLSAQMADVKLERLSEREVSTLTAERASMEGYVLFGDPAARLNIRQLQ